MSLFIQVTVVPGEIVNVSGVKAMLSMVIRSAGTEGEAGEDAGPGEIHPVAMQASTRMNNPVIRRRTEDVFILLSSLGKD